MDKMKITSSESKEKFGKIRKGVGNRSGFQDQSKVSKIKKGRYAIIKSVIRTFWSIEILDQAHNVNKPTRTLNCLNTQNSGRSININNMNTLQSALQQLNIENP